MRLHRLRLLAAAFAATAAGAGAGAQDGPPRYEYCDTEEHRQFDFWVGLWEVYDTDSNDRVADSRIEKLAGGCAIVERYMPSPYLGTSSVSTWRPTERRWRQFAVTGVNDLEIFEGGMVDGAMVLNGTSTRRGGAVLTERMTYRPAADGSLRQIIESSANGGKEWTLLSDLTYRRSPASDPPMGAPAL